MKRFLLPLLFLAGQAIAQPVLIKDINPGANSSSPGWFTKFGNKIVFLASDEDHGMELWQLENGQASMVADLCPGKESGVTIPMGFNLGVVNGKLYFPGRSQYSLNEHYDLYSWDGSGTPALVHSFITGHLRGNPQSFITCNNRLYFAYKDSLWMHDPAMNVTNQLGNMLFFDAPVAMGNKVYFTGADEQIDIELYELDASNNKIQLLADLVPGSRSSSPSALSIIDNKLYFVAGLPAGGAELWSYDGVNPPSQLTNFSAGTEMISTSGFSSFPLTELYGSIYFGVYNPNTQKHSLCNYTLSTGITNTIPYGKLSANRLIKDIMRYGNKIYFSGGNASRISMFTYDGTNPPKEFFDFIDGWPVRIDDTLYISSQKMSDSKGYEPYKYYDPTLSVAEVPFAMQCPIYPNPTTSSWNFDLNSLKEDNLQLIITDVTGRVVSKQQVNSDRKISATAPAPGMYLYYVTDNAGTAIQRGKLQRL